ncbi:MAG: DUF4159 domain-containing protein [Rhodospirillales bacterium]|nr:DUF4159 domain-containing protein [Rhodospirillales bacterium]
MIALGPLSFAAPWALVGLALLPAIWLLLRLMPPAPMRMGFPPIRLLMDLSTDQESTATSPLWLLLLRLLMAAALILGIAHPLLNASSMIRSQGPLILIIDDGWAAARDWPARQTMIGNLLDQAGRENRQVAVVTTAKISLKSARPAVEFMTAKNARDRVAPLQPKPWATDRKEALQPLLTSEDLLKSQPGHVIWLSDGLEEGGSAKLVTELRTLGAVTVISDPSSSAARLLRPPSPEEGVLVLEAVRPDQKGEETIRVRALATNGNLLAREDMVFKDGQKIAAARLELPVELRNRLERLIIEGQETAGSVVLADERWRVRPAGLLDPGGTDSSQPLLGSLYYLERALKPFTEVRRGTLSDLLGRQLAVLVLADPPLLKPEELDRISKWIKAGGVLLRFAGPRLAVKSDGLTPVDLRLGNRALGGAMSWDQPVTLAPFEDTSPFFGLKIPTGKTNEISIRRQLLAKPALDLADKTWVKLSDGTPLVTAAKQGDGWLILVHTTANTTWSNLALSGLFVEMLRKVVALSQGVTAGSGGPPLEPREILDGFGRLGPPPPDTLDIAAGTFSETIAEPEHPPGYYGDESSRRALNLSASLPVTAPFVTNVAGIDYQGYSEARERDLRPWLLGLVLGLALIDLIASLALRGLLNWKRVAGAAAVILMFAPGDEVNAQTRDEMALAASLETRLAYVLTGNPQVDRTSRAGLSGLSAMVNQRTAAVLGTPVGVDPEYDTLSFFPLLYWPVSLGQPALSPRAAAQVNAYLLGGGTILFDTRDQSGSGTGDIVTITRGLDIPPLRPAPADHVLRRSFYLMKEFPGRWTGDTVWVEIPGERVNDGVSSVIIGSHDWAGAWALNDAHQPLFPVVPGGEKQREWAFRFGINLVMYVLTGNYKADQVHLPAIMERLSR